MRHIGNAHGWTSAESPSAVCGRRERGYKCRFAFVALETRLSIKMDAGLLPSLIVWDLPLEAQPSHGRQLILSSSSLLIR